MMFQAGILSAVLDPALDEVLAGLVAGADQRPGGDEAEAEGQSLAFETREHLGSDEFLDREVLLARPQVLPEREDVATHRAQIAHRGDHLAVRLAEPEHDAALGPHPAALVELEDVQRLAAGGAAGADARSEPLRRLHAWRRDPRRRADGHL